METTTNLNSSLSDALAFWQLREEFHKLESMHANVVNQLAQFRVMEAQQMVARIKEEMKPKE